MLKTAKEATDHNNDTVIMGVFYGHAHRLNTNIYKNYYFCCKY